jgi:prepilin-type N-terminal cleavage/methylation domain-containing protein
MRHPRAFTLVELMVAILLAAIMATVVAVSLAGSQRAARAEDVLGRIATFDRLAREHVRQFGRPNRLTFDLAQNTITRSPADADADADESHDTASTLHLPSGVHLARVVTAMANQTAGQASIPCSPDGLRPTYAILLNDTRNAGRWQLTIGPTGQTLEVRDEREVQDIFRAIRRGDDADR